MLYKTITFELLEQHPALTSYLQTHRQWRLVMERLASELQTRHRELCQQLTCRHPDASSSVISSQAGELAIAELQDRLHSFSDNTPSDPKALRQFVELLLQDSIRE